MAQGCCALPGALDAGHPVPHPERPKLGPRLFFLLRSPAGTPGAGDGSPPDKWAEPPMPGTMRGPTASTLPAMIQSKTGSYSTITYCLLQLLLLLQLLRPPLLQLQNSLSLSHPQPHINFLCLAHILLIPYLQLQIVIRYFKALILSFWLNIAPITLIQSLALKWQKINLRPCFFSL